MQGVPSETQVDEFPTFADLDQYEDYQFDSPVSMSCVSLYVVVILHSHHNSVYLRLHNIHPQVRVPC